MSIINTEGNMTLKLIFKNILYNAYKICMIHTSNYKYLEYNVKSLTWLKYNKK